MLYMWDQEQPLKPQSGRDRP
jgi:hypothetical protein